MTPVALVHLGDGLPHLRPEVLQRRPGSMLQVATAGSLPTICSAVATSSSARRPWVATTRPTMFTPDQPPEGASYA